MEAKIHDFIQNVAVKNVGQTEFIQAVQEVAETIIPFMGKNQKYNRVLKISW